MSAAPPIAPELIGTLPGGGPVLIGGRNRLDGRLVFPLPQGPDADLFEAVPLPSTGTLWSFTIQRFPPVSPPFALDTTDGFAPFAVGYVDLGGQIIVETRLLCDSFDDLRIGAPVELALEELRLADGREVLSFAFRILR